MDTDWGRGDRERVDSARERGDMEKGDTDRREGIERGYNIVRERRIRERGYR